MHRVWNGMRGGIKAFWLVAVMQLVTDDMHPENRKYHRHSLQLLIEI